MINSPEKYKPFCEECSSEPCNYYQKILEEDVCIWDKILFYLLPTKNPKKCLIKDQDPPEDSSLHNLNQLETEMVSRNNLEHQKLFTNQNMEIK